MSLADLSIPLREALVGASTITSQLPPFDGSFPVFTRRPVKANAPYPLIVVSPNITKTDQDGINDQRPVIVRDVSIYGQNDTPAKYRTVESLGIAVHDLFHSNRLAIIVPNWSVIDIRATGPQPGPVDDDATVARLVSLTIRLAKLN